MISIERKRQLRLHSEKVVEFLMDQRVQPFIAEFTDDNEERLYLYGMLSACFAIDGLIGLGTALGLQMINHKAVIQRAFNDLNRHAEDSIITADDLRI